MAKGILGIGGMIACIVSWFFIGWNTPVANIIGLSLFCIGILSVCLVGSFCEDDFYWGTFASSMVFGIALVCLVIGMFGAIEAPGIVIPKKVAMGLCIAGAPLLFFGGTSETIIIIRIKNK